MANVIFGLVAIAFGIWGLKIWWWSVAEVVRGLLPVAAILFGLVAIGAGIAAMRARRGEEDMDDLGDEEFEETEPAAVKQPQGQR